MKISFHHLIHDSSRPRHLQEMSGVMRLSMLNPRVGGGGEGGYPWEINSASVPLGRDFDTWALLLGREFDMAATLEGPENLEMSPAQRIPTAFSRCFGVVLL